MAAKEGSRLTRGTGDQMRPSTKGLKHCGPVKEGVQQAYLMQGASWVDLTQPCSHQ